MTYLLLIILTLIVSILLIRHSPKLGRDYFDAGLFIILPSSISVIALLFYMEFGFDMLYIKEHWLLFQDDKNLYKITLLHSILIFSFSFTYFLFNIIFQKQLLISYKNIYTDTFTSINKTSWVLFFIFISLIFFFFIGRYTGQQGIASTNYDTGILVQLKNLVAKIWGFSIPVILYLLVKDSKLVIVKLGVLVFIIAILNFILFGSRGGLLWFILTVSILETLKFRGNLVNLPIFLLTIFGGALLFSLLNVFESFYYGEGSWIFMLHLFEYQTFENNINIIEAIDNNHIEMRYGSTYIDSFFKFIPSMFRPYEITTLSNWYLDQFLPGKREEGFGAGFGAIAEGYLNFGTIGIVIEGFLVGLFASILKLFRFRYGLIGAIIYASFVINGYKFFRVDFGSILFKQIFDIFSILLMFFFVYMITNFLKRFIKVNK